MSENARLIEEARVHARYDCSSFTTERMLLKLADALEKAERERDELLAREATRIECNAGHPSKVAELKAAVRVAVLAIEQSAEQLQAARRNMLRAYDGEEASRG